MSPRQKRNLNYEDKFRAYLFKGDFERHKKICKNINVVPRITGVTVHIAKKKSNRVG